MHKNIFTYGTLQFPDIMRALTGRPFHHQEATLSGYRRYRIKGACFPGIVAEPHGTVSGRLYLRVDGVSLALLDRFESDFYQRIDTLVTTNEGTLVPAQTYVVQEGKRNHLSGMPWDPETFQRHWTARYRSSCREFHDGEIQAVRESVGEEGWQS